MLRELKVEQLALIEGLSVRFEPGFNVLTGETGAGKSMLVDAVGLAIGGRARADLVRAGAEAAVVEALFEPSDEDGARALDEALELRGLPSAGGTMVVRRVIDAGGRHRAYVNGSLATVSTLAEIASGLVAVCGQHEHVTLTTPKEALSVLDSFAQASLPGFEAKWRGYREAFAKLTGAREAFKALDEDPRSRAEREAFLRFQLSELESLAPKPGELEELESEQRRLAGAERLTAITSVAEAALYSSDDAMSAVLARVRRSLEEAREMDESLAESVEQLDEVIAIVSDLGRDLGDYSRRVDSDPVRLEQIEGRATALRRLARRYGGDLDAACDAIDSLREELVSIEEHEERLEAARELLRRAAEDAVGAAGELTGVREAAARRLERDVKEGLDRLGMRASRLELRVTGRAPRTTAAAAIDDMAESATSLGASGGDRVDIGLAGEPGAPLRSIGRVASGGELARLLLAFRRAVSEVDGVSTVVLDEVDAGIGGAVADSAGQLITELAGKRQVLCVTHLPQMAAHATSHLVVRKRLAGERVSITAGRVREEEREMEIARMLGGADIGDATLAHARDMLNRARPRPTKQRGRRAG